MKKRIGSVILTLAMVLALFPAAVVPARASTSVVTTEDELRAALNAGAAEIEIRGVIPIDRKIDISYNVTFTGDGVLQYSGTDNVTYPLHITSGASEGVSVTWDGPVIDGGTKTTCVWIAANNTFQLDSGAIRNGTCGVYLSGGNFVMNGGEISGHNSSGDLGGVRISNCGTFTMNGGSICNNVSSNSGGGVYINATCSFVINGGTIIGNTKYDVEVCKYSYSSDEGTFTMNGGVVGSVGGEGTKNLSGGVVGNDMSKATVANLSSAPYTIDNHTPAQTSAGENTIVNVYGATYNSATTFSGKGVINLYGCKVDGAVTIGGGATVNLYAGAVATHGYTAPTTAGTDAYNASGDRYGTVFGSGDAQRTTVSGGTLTVYDGTLHGGISVGQYNSGSSRLALYGAADGSSGALITGGSVTGDGGGVSLSNHNGNTLAMYGGAIVGNKNTNKNYGGGGVNIGNGSFVLYGGSISKNTAAGSGGGVRIASEKTFTMLGGTISGNTANRGGGVTNNGPFTMSGGTISDNTAEYNGGGVWQQSNGGSFTMTGGGIAGNTASEGPGGGVYVYNGTFAMSGGSITGNKAPAGGGVFINNNGEFKLSGEVTIKDNTASDDSTASNVGVVNYIDDGETYSSVITIGDALSNTDPIGVTAYAPDEDEDLIPATDYPIPFTDGGTTYKNCFTPDNSQLEIIESEGNLALALFHTVTFNNGGGTAVGQKAILHGEKITESETTTTRTGYTFDGWYKEYNYQTLWNFDTDTVTGDTTLYAKWTATPAAKPTVTAANVTMTYGDSGKSVSVTATPAEGHTITGYQWYSNATNSNTGGTPISGATNSAYALTGMNAGTYYYYCVVTTTRTDNGQTATATSSAATVTVNPKDISLGNCSYHFPTLIYDGAEQTIHFEMLQIGDNDVTEGKDYTLSGNTTGKDAGEYRSLTFTGIGNYTGTRDFTLPWTISKREVTLEWSNTSFTYDGTEKCPTATVSNLVDGDTCAVTVTGAQTNAGTYTAKATALDNSNYRLRSTTYSPNANSKSFTIAKATPTVTTWPTLSPITYGQMARSGDLIGGVASVPGTFSYGDTVLEFRFSAGSTPCTVHFNPTDSDSYNSTSQNLYLTINPAPLTVTADAKSKTYGDADPALTYTASGFQWSDTASVITGALSRAAGDSVGSYAITQGSLSAGGNYAISFTGANLTISRRDITIKANDQSVALDSAISGAVGDVSIVSGTLVDGHSINAVTLTPSSTESVTTNGTITPSEVVIKDGSGNVVTGNYNVTYEAGVLTVTKIAPTVTAPTANTLTYTGEAQALVTAGSAVGGTMRYSTDNSTWNDDIPTGMNAGDYTVYYKVAGDANHSDIAAQSVSVTISPKTVTVSGITASDRVYDGTTTATLSYDGVSFGGVVNGDALTVSATGAFADKNVGTDKAVTISDLSLSGAKAGNYQLAATGQQTGTTANITAKAITVSGITAESKVYDGNTTATLKYDGVTFSGKIDGDTLTVTATGTFDSAAKGTGKTVTISGLTLGGTSASNYVLAAEGQQTTTTANITGATTSVTTIPTASAITYGQTLANSTLTGGVGSVAGTFSWTAPTTAPAVSDSGVTEYDVTFTPTDEENYAPSTCKVKLTVRKGTLTIVTAPTASEIGYGQTLAASTLTGGAAKNPYNDANVAGTFTWTTLTITPAKTDSNTTPYSVTFTPTDTANYNNAITAITLTVNKAALSPAPTVTMSGYTYGNTPSTPSVSSNPESTTVTYYYSTVSFLSSDPDKTAPTTGTEWTGITSTTLNAGTYFMRAVLAESANYAQYVTAQTTFTVGKGAKATPTNAITVDTTAQTATIAGISGSQKLEYVVLASGSTPNSETNGAVVPQSGVIALDGLKKNVDYKIYIRERSDNNQSASSWTTGTTFQISDFSVNYNANGGKDAPATQKSNGAASITVAGQDGMTRTGYDTFVGWNTAANGGGTSYAAGAPISDGATLYAQWTANSYTVQFNANGGTGMITDESFTYDMAQALTANTFTRDGYTFAGWSTSAGGPVLYGNGQSVKNLAVSGSVTLYAVWTQNTYAVSGSVTSGTNSTATVKLMQGNAQFATQDIMISGGSGSYNFTGVPAGTYNLVITQGDQTVTEIIVITSAGDTRNITIPTYKTSSVLEVKGEDTPSVVVGGLNNEASSKAEENKIVTITMTVEKQEAQQLPETATEAEQETQDAIEAIESAASGSDGVEYMNITVQKEVKSGSTTESTETLTTTNTVMEIVIPYDMDGKKNIKVYRHHNGMAAALTVGSNTDGTYQVDTANGLIYLYANQFSTYAIAYEVGSDPVTPPTPPAPPTPPSPSGGGTSYYTITVAGTEGGTVTTDHKTASRGATVTLTMTANDGFQLASLTVANGAGNNISLTRAGDKYTFSMPSSNVTVTAVFAPKPCAQDDTCPISAFTDADPTAWYHDGVHYVLENGIMSGYGGAETESFGPNDNTSRAMMAQILWNMEGKPVVNYLLTCSDVAEGMWYTEAVRWVTAEGIMNGYGDGLFGPDDAMTREQLVTIVHRYAIYKGVDVSVGEDTNILSYDDAFDVSEWAIPAMQWAVGSGAVGGRTDITLNPKDTATRAEIAAIVMRYYTEIAE